MEKLIAFLKTKGYNLYVILLVVGGYLAYLAYQLFTDAGATKGSTVPVYIGASVFALSGGIIVLTSLFALAKGYYSEKADNSGEQTAPLPESEDESPDETEE